MAPSLEIWGSARIFKTEVAAMLDMSGSLRSYGPVVTSSFGVAGNKPFLQSPFLSGARVEPGSPDIRDGSSFIRDNDYRVTGATYKQNGLFTSGSWSYEAIYKFEGAPAQPSHFLTQSLVRICTTGSQLGHGAHPNLLVNLIAFWTGSKPRIWFPEDVCSPRSRQPITSGACSYSSV